MDAFEACGKFRNPMIVAYGNVVRCEPGTKLNNKVRNILHYNFQASRAANGTDLGWFDKPEIIRGVDPETDEALYGWWVEVPVCGCEKAISLHQCVKLPTEDCPLMADNDEPPAAPTLDADGNFPHPFEDWNSPEDAVYDNAE